MRRITILLAAVGVLLLVPAAQALANGTIAVHIEGTGSGEVVGLGNEEEFGFPGKPPLACTYASPGPEEGTCTTELSASFLEGIEMKAIAGGGSLFAGWTNLNEAFAKLNPCSKNTCGGYTEFEEPAWEVTAVFCQEGELLNSEGNCGPPQTLTVVKTGLGSGYVFSTKGEVINCGETCSAEFGQGIEVILKTSAGAGNEFTSWAGCDSESVEGGLYYVCTVTMSENKTVTAQFGEEPISGPPLTLNIEEGSGTVVTNPGGFECSGSEGESCSTEEVEEGTVTLTASPAPGYLFKSWKKCDKKELIGEVQYGVNGRQCTINLNEAKEVSAKFVKSWSLTASKAGGIGKLQSKPGGILCLFNCETATASFKDGFTVEAVNKPAKHFHFVEYLNGTGSAEGCNGETSCSFVISSDSSVEGLFEEDPKVALSLSKTGGGQALIKSHPSGILCAYTCSSIEAEFYEGESVEIAWKLNKGTTSIEWSSAAGTCEGTSEATEGSCTVPMSEAHSLVADLQ